MNKKTKDEMRKFILEYREKDVPICSRHGKEQCPVCWFWFFREINAIPESLKI